MTEQSVTEKKFEHWCIVELMGHQRIAGLVTETNLFGNALMRVDVPGAEGRESFTKFYGASAIYAVTPVEEGVARTLAKAFDTRLIEEWRLRSLLPEPSRLETDEDGFAEDDEDDSLLYSFDELDDDEQPQPDWSDVDDDPHPEWDYGEDFGEEG